MKSRIIPLLIALVCACAVDRAAADPADVDQAQPVIVPPIVPTGTSAEIRVPGVT